MPASESIDIRALRIAAGLTQHQVATALGVSQPQLSIMELGYRPVSSDECVKIRAAIAAAFKKKSQLVMAMCGDQAALHG